MDGVYEACCSSSMNYNGAKCSAILLGMHSLEYHGMQNVVGRGMNASRGGTIGYTESSPRCEAAT